MALVSIATLRAMRPNWCVLENAEPLVLEPGATVEPHVCDANQFYFVMEGRLRTRENDEELEAEAGDVWLVRAGTVHGIPAVLENALVLRLNDLPQPPFRDGRRQHRARVTVALPPCEPFASPRSRGVSVHFDAASTFSPSALALEQGGDLLLFCNPGAMSRGQLDEIRNHCVQNGRALRGIVVALDSEREIADFLRDPYCGGQAMQLRPHVMGIEADLATEEGRRRFDAVRGHWGRALHVDGARPAVAMNLRKWSEEELVAIFGALAAVPPARAALILRWDPATFDTSPRGRLALETLLPWTAAVEFTGVEGADEAAHYLDAHGFQGCVHARL